MENKEIVYTVLMQIKKNISTGNLYDFLVADFISKSKEQQGIKIEKPIIFNINGQKTLDLLEKEKINPSDTNKVDKFIEDCKKTIIKELNDFGINFSYQIDDRLASEDIEAFLEKDNYKDLLQIGDLNITKCSNCGKDFGTDSSIRTCKYCGGTTYIQISNDEISQLIDHNILEEKINMIDRLPGGTKSKLLSYIQTLPQEYCLQISKNKGFTSSIKNKSLDPRFVTIITLLLDSIGNGKNIKKTIIHGDVIKKYDYYMLLHTSKEDLPSTIVSHGNITDENYQKLRWDLTESKGFKNYSPKALRCLLLKNDIFKGVKIDEQEIENQIKQVSKY